MIDRLNPWRHRRRPDDSPDVCIRVGCGVSLAGRVTTALYCSDRCKDKSGKKRRKK